MMTTKDNHEAGPFEPVALEDGCPNCGERESDELLWLDDERVECQRCRTVYRPGTAASEGGQTDASPA